MLPPFPLGERVDNKSKLYPGISLGVSMPFLAWRLILPALPLILASVLRMPVLILPFMLVRLILPPPVSPGMYTPEMLRRLISPLAKMVTLPPVPLLSDRASMEPATEFADPIEIAPPLDRKILPGVLPIVSANSVAG